MIDVDPSVAIELANIDKRINNRTFDAYRDIVIEPSFVSLAEGSCRVKIGDTDVVAGVKFAMGTPYPDSLDSGTLTVNAEFLTFASKEFELGPPREDSVELARVVDRCIRESQTIDMKKLCITPGEKVWTVCIDIDIINADGNLIDAATLAAMKSLLLAKVPELDETTGRPKFGEKGKIGLPLSKIAVNTTFVKINDKILADPCRLEEDAMDARLTVGSFVTLDGNERGLCAMQKGGSGGFTPEEVFSIIDMVDAKADALRNLIK
ncbi:MAG: exosome complex protein Rrp42 [Candidatus Aenigmatarchaeota archaeon]